MSLMPLNSVLTHLFITLLLEAQKTHKWVTGYYCTVVESCGTTDDFSKEEEILVHSLNLMSHSESNSASHNDLNIFTRKPKNDVSSTRYTIWWMLFVPRITHSLPSLICYCGTLVNYTALRCGSPVCSSHGGTKLLTSSNSSRRYVSMLF